MWLFVAGGALFLVFLISYIRDPRTLRTGVLLLSSVMVLVLAFSLLNTPLGESVRNIALPLIAILILVGYVALVSPLLINGFIVVRREGVSLATLLPLIVDLILIAVPAFMVWAASWSATRSTVWIPSAGVMAFGILAYFGFVFLSFVTYGSLYRLRKGSKAEPAILILGSRIFDGQVPPLLASRLDCALDVYEARKAAGDQTPLLVCCGGQGADEDRPEADAMADYLLSKGVPEIDIRREDQSTTTRENLIFGSAIVFEDYPAAPILISTNDYHALRTALLSRDLKLDARVLSAKTAKYYVPAAFLREFVAILRDYFWAHVGFLTLLIAFIGFLVWESLQMR